MFATVSGNMCLTRAHTTSIKAFATSSVSFKFSG
jgi:hypothetical protein